MSSQPKTYSGKYLVHNKKLRTALWLADLLSRCLAPFGRRRQDSRPPRSILLCNPAHIGDVLISLAAVALVREAFPQARIGFLAGSWSKAIVENHPDIDAVHIVDNFYINRAPLPLKARLARHASTWFSALREIRARDYDVAVDLYFYWPNFIPLLWAARIPRRIGFESGGFGPLLTDGFPWQGDNDHVARSQCALLQALGIPARAVETARGVMKPEPVPLPEDAARVLSPQGYIILHPGTGAVTKEWLTDSWIETARCLAARGWQLAITGQGAREDAVAGAIAAAVPGTVNLCSRLSWQQFFTVVANARLLVGMDSMSCHLAAACSVPFVGIYSGTTRTTWWRPLGEGTILLKDLPCAPCLQPAGCDSMDCLRQITPQEVCAAVFHETGDRQD